MDWTIINKIHDHLIDAVQAQDGKVWKESASELHSQYNEMPFWVLLYEDSDVNEVHKVFKSIVSPHFGDIDPVQILNGADKVKLGEFPIADPKSGDSFFRSFDSKR